MRIGVTYINDKYKIDFKTKDTLYQVAFDIEDEKTLEHRKKFIFFKFKIL